MRADELGKEDEDDDSFLSFLPMLVRVPTLTLSRFGGRTLFFVSV